jgi:hypothetical protein
LAKLSTLFSKQKKENTKTKSYSKQKQKTKNRVASHKALFL